MPGCVALAGCSGDSPSPSNPTPPGGNQSTWAITALTVSNSQPYVDTAVVVTATVTKDGNPAPDGTTVEFTSPPGSAEGAQQVATSGGQASTGISSETAGTYSIRARVNTVSRTVSVTFVDRHQSDVFSLIPPLMPDHGAYDGQEQVLIRGKAIAAPAEVDFIVGSTTYPAVVVSVQESAPIESEGSITIRTPAITDVDRTTSSSATVVVRVGVGTSNPQTAQLPAGFTYLAETALWILQPFEPNTGSYEGSESITLRGRGIAAPAEVVFTLGAQDFAGVVQEVVESDPSSAEGSIVVATPYIPEALRPSAVHENGYTYFLAEAVDVTVTIRANSADAQTMMVPKAFTYIPDETPPPAARARALDLPALRAQLRELQRWRQHHPQGPRRRSPLSRSSSRSMGRTLPASCRTSSTATRPRPTGRSSSRRPTSPWTCDRLRWSTAGMSSFRQLSTSQSPPGMASRMSRRRRFQRPSPSYRQMIRRPSPIGF